MALTSALSWGSWRVAGRPLSELPSWLEAWATLIGVGAAIVAGFYAARAFGLESQREHRWEEAQRASQAALIAAWPAGLSLGTRSSIEDVYTEEDPEAIVGARALLRNASALPATEVEVDFWLVLMDETSVGRDRRLLGSERLAYLPPTQENLPVSLDLTAKPHGRTPSEVEHSELRVEVRFRDAAGQVWSRDAIGQLVVAR
ncbi:hypothetical protein [Nocardioides houyundeii]|uniref:hypothetical protein n=1 Tax=Nocardioides houyundeii TaxID=2045452 RepID=UPI0013152C22|nr:hypothetical protein [Nocardioides houyundeii]